MMCNEILQVSLKMSETDQTNGDRAERNDDDNAEQLKCLTLNEKDKVSKQNEYTPTVDYLQVP